MRVHLSGVGGIGMSALARYFLSQGDQVSGSDPDHTILIDELVLEGVRLINAQETIDSDIHIYTEAVPVDDIQRQYALDNKIPSYSYFEYLGQISEKRKTIAVCGTHGKSTCTSMIGIALKELDQDPLVIVGTKVKEFDGKNINISSKDNSIFVVEACEYRESFLNLSPNIIVLTNCEYDHADYYKTEEDYLVAFIKFIKKMPQDGVLIANTADHNVNKILKQVTCKVVAVNLNTINNPLTPQVPGRHNQFNAELSFAAIKSVLSKQDVKIKKSLSQFNGTWRRFDVLLKNKNHTVIDDYAHHPTEIKCMIQSLVDYAKNRRIIVVFQAHQYSRTRELFDDFIVSFDSLSLVNHLLLINDIYQVRDKQEDIEAVSAQKLVDAIKNLNVVCSGSYDDSVNYLKSIIKPGDIICTMGAGPVNIVANKLVLYLTND